MRRLEYVSFLNLSGYAQAAKHTLNALLDSGSYDIRIVPLDARLKDVCPADRQKYRQCISKKSDSSRVQILHVIPDMHRRFGRNLMSISVGVYETFKPPAHWVAILNSNDAVIVPSKFNLDIFRQAGVKKPLFYLPHCLDMKKYCPSVLKMYDYEEFTFLFLGSWRKRKGYEELLEAWGRAFSVYDDVKLIIKTDKPSVAQEYIRRKFQRQNVAPVVVDLKSYTDDEMPSFIRSADCLISPTRGEGFGYPGLQSMALETPVIISNCSGCTEYANEQTAFLLQPEGVRYEKCLDGIPQFSRKEWIFISPEQIGRVMKKVWLNSVKAVEKSKAARLYVENKFSYNAMVQRFDAMIDELKGE